MRVIKFFLSLIFVVGVVVGIYGLYYVGNLYSQVDSKIENIIDYKPKLTTKIYDRKHMLIANLFDEEHREYVKYDDIPARVIEALLAIEDTNFFEHKGLNIDAIVRAVIKDIKAKKFVEGASTITQQLVKNMVLSRQKKIERKIQEALIALIIEQKLSKEEILERYLNQVYFGHGYYGIKTAAKGYFHKNLNELNLKEIGILVGLPRAPSYYNPTKHYEIALTRANRVISRMHELGWIDDKTFLKEIERKPKVYDESLTKNIAPYVVDEVVRRLSKNIEDLKGGGYKIYTSIDLEYQNIAKSSLKKGYEDILKRGRDYNYSKLNGALVVLKQNSGDILALVGGVDYKKSSFNRATQAKRQPGSAFKPFIYLTALNLGYSQVSKIADIARTYEFEIDGEKQIWKPKNYERNFEGEITLKEALIHSRNLATINLVDEIGLSRLYKKLKELGFENLPKDLSLALGSLVLSPLELAKFYTIISNYGVKVEPRLVLEVLDKDDKVVFKNIYKSQQVTEPKQSFLMIDILKNVVNRGTGRGARVWGVEVAGKTGTTNNYIDAWFCGFTPDIEVITWFGQDNNYPLKKKEAGGRAAAPVVGDFIRKVYKLHPELSTHFKKPEGVYEMRVDGKIVYYTDISKPKLQESKEVEEILY
jgi:penicillin-binding protein 1A